MIPEVRNELQASKLVCTLDIACPASNVYYARFFPCTPMITVSTEPTSTPCSVAPYFAQSSLNCVRYCIHAVCSTNAVLKQ